MNTLWGELAWQLGGESAYERVKDADLSAVKSFDRKFILAGTFASQIKVNPTNLAEKLMALGMKAVSGPKIDGALVYLFKRADIDRVDVNALSQMTQYPTKAGRKPKKDSNCVLRAKMNINYTGT